MQDAIATGTRFPLQRAGLARSLLAVLLAASLVVYAPVSEARGEVGMALLEQSERAQLEKLLTSEVQRTIDRQARLEGQGERVVVLVRLDVEQDFIIIDLDPSYLPTHYGAPLEDLLRELQTYASESLTGLVTVRGVTFLFAGKDISHYFPEAAAQLKQESGRNSAISSAGGPTQTVMISAMHGYYRHRKTNRWVLQRPEQHFGIHEDLITPDYADELLGQFTARGHETTVFGLPRSRSIAIHQPSGHQWRDVAALYNLELLYPDNPEIWNVPAPNRLNYHRDYSADMNSRPFFANHIGADTAIHLHTNAGPADASGTRAYYQTGRDMDRALAATILCSMKEVIRAQPAYADWIVASHPSAGNYGENREASMPSVIVEIAFHTNGADAIALQDPIFRTAAMKGLEKGQRLHTAGETDCSSFTITGIPDVSGPHNTDIPVEVAYQVHPQFSVTRETEVVQCASGWTCSGYRQTYDETAPSPLAFNFRCNAPPSRSAATFRWRTTLTDADGVVASAFEHSSTCLPAGEG